MCNDIVWFYWSLYALMNTTFALIAFVCYLLATRKLSLSILPSPIILAQSTVDITHQKKQALILGIIGTICNGILLYRVVLLPQALDLGFSNTWSLICCMLVFSISLIALSKSVENLLLVFFPLAAFGLVLVLFLPGHRLLVETATVMLKTHVFLSILSYSVLAIAACQSILLAFQDSQLRYKKSLMVLRLPPMQKMEDLLAQTLICGFFILSLSLATGFMFVHDILAQHLAHKTFFSITAWFVFAILLWGRWYFGWRGKTMSRWTLSGFSLLMLAFFGSKLVLETILMRI